MSNPIVPPLGSGVKPRHHILIAGTGRAGTSVLVRILTACGFDTELSRNPGAWWSDAASAGFETMPLIPGEHPYVVKSPWTHQFVRQLLDDRNIRLDHVLVPLRRLEEAAASRIVLDIQQLYQTEPALLDLEDDWTVRAQVPGGVIYSLQPIDVARVLAHSFHRLIEVLIEREVPVHFLSFPRFCNDLDYLLRALAPILPADIDRATLIERITRVIEPDKIRMANEIAGTDGDATTAAPTVAYPELSRLHAVALKREVKRLSVELAEKCTQLKTAGEERDTLTNALLDAASNAKGLEKLLEETRMEMSNLRTTLKAENSRTDVLRSLQSGLREAGNRLTGGGVRALMKRVFTKLFRRRRSLDSARRIHDNSFSNRST